jgi:hypothetical protein
MVDDGANPLASGPTDSGSETGSETTNFAVRTVGAVERVVDATAFDPVAAGPVAAVPALGSGAAVGVGAVVATPAREERSAPDVGEAPPVSVHPPARASDAAAAATNNNRRRGRRTGQRYWVAVAGSVRRPVRSTYDGRVPSLGAVFFVA